MSKLGIYVQVPFCQTKCTYCNFHTGVVAKERFAPYVEAVCREIREHGKLLEAAGIEWPSPARPEQEKSRSLASPPQRARTGLAGGPGSLGMTHGWVAGQRCGNLVETVYFGGGTPSLLEPGLIERILDEIRMAFGGDGSGRLGSNSAVLLQREGGTTGETLAASSGTDERSASEGGPYRAEFGTLEEVTLEADPETVELAKAEAWVRAGINRVSFGVQSFSDKELAAAGRMHRRVDVYRAVPILRAAGIGNISFDLIAGLPHQTRESWRRSLEELVELGPEHVSVYLLEVDEGSRLGKELLKGGVRYSARAVPSEDEMAEFYELAQEMLGGAGYRQYEISNWAKPGFESKHNLKYWRREPYLGFGAGAHSFSGTERWANAHDAASYVNAVTSGRLPVEQYEVLTAEMALEEELFLGLRQLEGIDVARIEREYGVRLGGRFEPLTSAGLVEREGEVVRLAKKRLSVSNEVFVELMK